MSGAGAMFDVSVVLVVVVVNFYLYIYRYEWISLFKVSRIYVKHSLHYEMCLIDANLKKQNNTIN